MQNDNGLTLTRWASAAGYGKLDKIPKEAVAAWYENEDPADWFLANFSKG